MSAPNAGKDRVELLLALGATRLEATRALLQHAVSTALTPVLNQMAVIGLVSIPGMMTGQILGGSSPAQVPVLYCHCTAMCSFIGPLNHDVLGGGGVLNGWVEHVEFWHVKRDCCVQRRAC